MKQVPEARSLLTDAFSARWNPDMGDDYYSDLSQGSLCLFMASAHMPGNRRRSCRQGDRGHRRGSHTGRYNTISSSYASLALTAYASSSALTAQQRLRVTRKVKEGTWEELALFRHGAPEGRSALRLPRGELSNPTGNTVYYQVRSQGSTSSPPTRRPGQGMEAFREYTDVNGKPLVTIPVGGEVKVHVKIRTVDAKEPVVGNVAIIDMLPSGFEIVYDRAADTPFGDGSLKIDSVEPREDRVLIFCTAESAVKDFVYTIRSTNKGKLAIPPVFAESMYDKKVWSQHPAGGYITVGD